MVLPDASETDRTFYADVWHPQETHHGLILDRLQTDLGRPPANANNTLSPRIKVLGLLSHLRPVHEVVRLLNYLTGAATERSAVLAYNQLAAGMRRLGESAVAETIVDPIKRQEPGHFAFYALSARAMIHQAVLAPWQLHLARLLRRRSFRLVGAGDDGQRADFGSVVVSLGLDRDLRSYARHIAVVERELLWAREQGLKVPPYVLAALTEALGLYRSRVAPLGPALGSPAT